MRTKRGKMEKGEGVREIGDRENRTFWRGEEREG